MQLAIAQGEFDHENLQQVQGFDEFPAARTEANRVPKHVRKREMDFRTGGADRAPKRR